MRSRLAELTGGDPSDAGDVELGNASSNYMGDFFAKVDEAKAGISTVKKASKRIRRITDERMLATSTNEEQGASRELGPLVDRTNATIKQTKNLLNELAEEDSSLKASEQRIRKNLASTLARKFGDVCRDYQKEQTRYKDEVQATVKRQLEIVQPDVTEEEIDTVLRSGGPGQVMRSAILRGAADPVKDAYAHAADRYQDVLKLEQSVAELHQMFLDFALLTEQQGEMLDQIEYQVKAAGEYVEEGNVDIKKAIQYQKEIRKRYCCLIVLILVIVLVLMGVLGAFDQEDTGDKEDRRRLRDAVGE
jgi:t-SNARE complex subunit (syntaxin)